MPHDVFISYSSKDKTAADAVCAVLERHGVRSFIAPRDILAGRDWGEAIIEGIENSRLFILVFSRHANTSQQIKREVERAVSKGITVVPLRIEDVVGRGTSAVPEGDSGIAAMHRGPVLDAMCGKGTGNRSRPPLRSASGAG